MTLVVTSTLAARQFFEMFEEIDQPLTQLKLMKLTYIAQGWHLGIYGKPLIDENVHAWPHGPVFQDLYHATKKFGKFPVTEVPRSDREVNLEQNGRSKIQHGGLEIIAEVNATYRDKTAWQLREMTHKTDSPWDQTRIIHGGVDTGPVIENNLIQKYYSDMLN